MGLSAAIMPATGGIAEALARLQSANCTEDRAESLTRLNALNELSKLDTGSLVEFAAFVARGPLGVGR